jgi:solute carrier family 34 (sodium-dependent phosphate cotransporter)
MNSEDNQFTEPIERADISVPKVGESTHVLPLWQRWGLDKVALFIFSLFLFILSLTLMKIGARSLSPLIEGRFAIQSPANSLGFGWLSAYLLMSGSPVAAASLTFFDAGILSELNTFFMITGSRLGASFIVLLIGFIYVLRGRSRANSLGMGLLSLVVTGSTYVAALGVGIWLLRNGILSGIQLQSGSLLESVFDLIFTPITQFLLRFLPQWSLFVVGLGLILVTFNLFDRAIPQVSLSESQVGHLGQFVYRPMVMFGLGALVTLISMSVSVSLAILVPLSQRGFVKRENVTPYIMGANVTTFVDTLLAAVLVNNHTAFTIVLAQMVSVAVVSMVILLLAFETYQHAMLKIVRWVISGPVQMVIFMVLILVIPLFLLLM